MGETSPEIGLIVLVCSVCIQRSDSALVF